MLRKLTIQNYAIIDSLEMEFSGNLNIITGETGAGKSILMGALALILGDRADSTVLLNREKKCIVEGLFRVEEINEVTGFLQNNDLDAGEELVIRREISIQGKSRAFVNDTPVTLEQLRQLCAMLVDLHRQFDVTELGESAFQRDVLDALAGNASIRQQYSLVFGKWQQARETLDTLLLQKEQLSRETDYNRFLFSELEEVAFHDNEIEDAATTLKLLNNSEGIKNALSALVLDLTEGEQPLVHRLKILINQVQPFTGFHPQLPALLERLHSAQIELRDIAAETEQLNDQVNYDPEQIARLDERLSIGYKLLKKHGVQTTRELLDIRDKLEEKLLAIENMDGQINEQEKIFIRLEKEAAESAEKLTKSRSSKLTFLEKSVNELLQKVGMPNARFRVSLQPLPAMQAHGMDAVEYLFDANKSGRFEPVRKVASGGELSRLMLCIKSLVAESLDLPTLIFDEIDTGISGEAARQVGGIMKALGRKRQVISITHQPQIAGKADTHFLVFKEIVSDQIKTGIRRLSEEERIVAIARMLGGEKPTAAAMENAREMMMN